MLKSVAARKAIVFAVAMLPMLGMLVMMITNPPVDPYERIAKITGDFALRLLLLTLLITPLKQAFNWRWIGAYRRTLGVACFTYAVVHMLAYQIFESGFDISYMIEDIAKRRYILLGALAFMFMVPLGLSSNNFSVRKLGCKLWKRIHMLVFPIAFFAIGHLYLQTRGDKTEPLIYLGILVLLVGWRLIIALRKRAKPQAG